MLYQLDSYHFKIMPWQKKKRLLAQTCVILLNGQIMSYAEWKMIPEYLLRLRHHDINRHCTFCIHVTKQHPQLQLQLQQLQQQY